MPELIPIQSLTTSNVREALFGAVACANPLEGVTEFMASVDWSTTDGEPDAEVVAMLAEAEGLATEAAESDISLDDFEASIRQLASTWRIPSQAAIQNTACSTVIASRVSVPPRARTERIFIVSARV